MTGTGRNPDAEKARLALILDWMWGTVLPTLQPIADARGFGPQWLTMTQSRTKEAADAAALAAARVARVADASLSWVTFDPVGLLRRLVELVELQTGTEAN